MSDFCWFVVTAAIGTAGGLLALKLKVPVGGVLGAMFAVILLNIISKDHAYFYNEVKVAAQLAVGALTGSKVGRKELRELGKLIIPALIIFPLLLVYNLLFGTLIYYHSSLDAYTSLFSLTPGSISDVAIIAEELGADRAAVGLIHAMRLLVCGTVLPPIFAAVSKKNNGPTESSKSSDNSLSSSQPSLPKPIDPEQQSIPRLIGLFCTSACGGLLFRALAIQGGTIVGAILFSMIYTCVFGKSKIPKPVKRCQQIIIGSYVGSGVVIATILNLKTLCLPIIYLVVYLIFATFASAFLVMKTGQLDLVSAMACCAPGGISEILLITDELGGDVSKVGVIHAFRIFVVLAVFPPTICWFITLLP